MGRLVRTINATVPDESREDAHLEKLLDLLWPDLQSKVDAIIGASIKGKPKKAGGADKSGPILEELLVLVRQQSQIISDPTQIVPPAYIRDLLEEMVVRRDRDRMDPAAFDDLSRYWKQFTVEWRAAVINLPLERIDAVAPSYRRLHDIINYIVDRAARRRHPRYGRPPTRVGMRGAQSSLSTAAADTPALPTSENQAKSSDA